MGKLANKMQVGWMGDVVVKGANGGGDDESNGGRGVCAVDADTGDGWTGQTGNKVD